jgi:hypothetical protein
VLTLKSATVLDLNYAVKRICCVDYQAPQLQNQEEALKNMNYAQQFMRAKNTSSQDEYAFILEHARYWALEIVQHNFDQPPKHRIFATEYIDSVIT